MPDERCPHGHRMTERCLICKREPAEESPWSTDQVEIVPDGERVTTGSEPTAGERIAKVRGALTIAAESAAPEIAGVARLMRGWADELRAIEEVVEPGHDEQTEAVERAVTRCNTFWKGQVAAERERTVAAVVEFIRGLRWGGSPDWYARRIEERFKPSAPGGEPD